MWQNSYDGKSTLYLIPTPIGNLEDITIRSLNVLKKIKVVFSEDTRITSLLLKNYEINAKLYSLHEHNEDKVKEKVLEFLENGEDIAIVTDRGTPIISDPGYKTVAYVASQGYNIVSLPGATAFVPALTVSGIEPQPFLFYGFLNSKDSKKRRELEKIKQLEYTIIFYEAPHRIFDTLNMMLTVLGNRKISISREISKKYESVYRGDIENLLKNFPVLKGEFVIVLEGNKKLVHNEVNININELVDEYARLGHSISESIKYISKKYNISKNIVYSEYHKNKGMK